MPRMSGVSFAPATPRGRRGASVTAGVFCGVGVAGFVDETVFHQLLHWHHFWDGGSTDAGLVSDGLFHAGSWICLVAGLFWFADQRRRATLVTRAWAAGILLGAGGFQLYDGLVQHLIFHLHQIRYGVNITPYNIAWNVLAGVILILGALLLRRHTSEPPMQADPGER